jgi:hypothetical protein
MSEPQEFHVSPTSRKTADVEDLVLRRGERTRLVFRPMIVANANDRRACVRGEFRYQKKSVSDTWEDCDTRSLSELTVEDGGFKLELHAGEVRELHQGVSRLIAIFEHEGIPEEAETYTVAQGELGRSVRAILDRRDELDSLGPDRDELVRVLIDVLLQTEAPAAVARLLAGTGADTLSKLSTASQVAQLDGLLATWRANLLNADEGWWQSQFEENAWVLPQIFGQPFVMLQGQAFMGGKRIDNSGGHVLDLAFRNALTDNVALVEIKTPKTPLLGSKVRQGVWAFSPELSGSVTQLLSYKDDLQKEYYQRVGSTRRSAGQHFEVFNPRCVLLVGNVGEEMDGNVEKVRCLDLARNDFRSVELVTYDEMVLRMELLLDVLSGSVLERREPETETSDDADLPF